MNIVNKKIFIFGGSGSLGNQLIKKYAGNNNIICYSRDECKHWEMGLRYNNNNIKFIIGDIRDYSRVETSLLRESPDIIIIAAALKHIDRCEFAIHECLNTDVMGTKNVVDCIEKNADRMHNLKTVCFVSTDKACSPVNVYGMCKALSEKLIIEKSYTMDRNKIKFVCVRYGNVLNSRGSIIPILHKIGNDLGAKHFSLTHEGMTRFVMSLEQSVDLIEHAILDGTSGDIIIPKIVSMKVKHLLEIFSNIYGKPIVITSLRPGEKLLESLVNETESVRLVKSDNYMCIKPSYLNKIFNENPIEYNSNLNPITKNELNTLLIKLELL